MKLCEMQTNNLFIGNLLGDDFLEFDKKITNCIQQFWEQKCRSNSMVEIWSSKPYAASSNLVFCSWGCSLSKAIGL